MLRFLQIIVHNAAPEHESNIREAIALCDSAERELVLCFNVSNRLPGTFNMACSTIYGGFYAGVGDLDKTWDDSADMNKDAGYDDSTARVIVTAALSKRGTPEQRANGLSRRLVRKDFMSLEVTEVVPAAPMTAEEWADPALFENKYFCRTQALGKLRVKTWRPEDPDAESDDAEDDWQPGEFDIWLEKIAYQYCFVGMHLEACVHTMDDGLVFIDTVTVRFPPHVILFPQLTIPRCRRGFSVHSSCASKTNRSERGPTTLTWRI